MRRHLGYYAHHHGGGHVTRAAQILQHVRTPAVLLTSKDGVSVPSGTELVPLPLDVMPDREALELPPVPGLHYAPGDVPGLRARVERITDWIVERDPALLVVDVSAEVTLLARVAGVPVVVVRQHGWRDDEAHRNAFAAASLLLAPWPSWLEHPGTPREVVDRTVHVGGFSRLEGRDLVGGVARRTVGHPDRRQVVVISGSGGAGWSTDDVRAAADATPRWHWTVLGRVVADHQDQGNLTIAGWVDDPMPYLRAADVVVASAGHNTVMDVAAARRPLVVIPEPRPYDEQLQKAQLLARHGAALVSEAWPPPREWDDLLERARAVGPGRLPELLDGDGARRAASVLDDLVDRLVARAA